MPLSVRACLTMENKSVIENEIIFFGKCYELILSNLNILQTWINLIGYRKSDDQCDVLFTICGFIVGPNSFLAFNEEVIGPWARDGIIRSITVMLGNFVSMLRRHY